MKKISGIFLIILMLLPLIVAAEHLDLPIKRVGGDDYYYYKVGRNENIASVAERLGLSRDDIIRSNPGASDGLRPSMILYFLVSEYAEDNTSLPGQATGLTGNDSPTRYKVQRGETLYGIAHRFGISPDEILAMNPEVSGGVRSGQILLIPHSGAETGNMAYHASEPPTMPSVIVTEVSEPDPQPEENIEKDAPETEPEPQIPTIKIPEQGHEFAVVEVVPEGSEDEPQAADEILTYMEEDSVSIEPASIVLMMPLMLNENADTKAGRQAVDFVRGFMLGLKNSADFSVPVNVNVVDTESSTERIASLISAGELANADVVIAHEEGPAGSVLPQFARENEVYILNLFSSHDTTYLENPYFIQANIPAQMMYEKAAQALMSTYEGYTPVILAAKGGRGEKVPFTNYVRNAYHEKGIEAIELVYEGMLTSADVENLDQSKKYVFIPVSGALSEFNKFAQTLASMRNYAADPSSVGLFGYPDWTTFRGESLELLHRLNATIYSRFYCDEFDLTTRDFTAEFEKTYGSRPLEQVPSQALLGYDSARFLIRNIKNNEGEFSPASSYAFRGIQSSFMLAPVEEDSDSAGYVNTSLYIITYLPGARVMAKVL